MNFYKFPPKKFRYSYNLELRNCFATKGFGFERAEAKTLRHIDEVNLPKSFCKGVAKTQNLAVEVNFVIQGYHIAALIFFFGIFLFAAGITPAQVSQESSGLSPREERQALEEELKKLEGEITQYETNINKTQSEKKTLENKIYILKNKIKKLDLEIQQSNLMIKDLSGQIDDTESSIKNTSLKIDDYKEKLAVILRTISEEDRKSFVEIIFSESNISDFFDDLVALDNLNSRNKDLLSHIKKLKNYLEDEKNSLDKEKDELENIVIVQTLQKEEGESTKKNQEKLLKETQGKESLYQKMLADSKKKIKEIRSRIFELIGVPSAPTFGEAYELAKFVSEQTGVRPAFLLAVLTQESNIGKNVGRCFLVNASTGEGVRVESGKKEPRTMSPKRDTTYFLEITKGLGRDPYNTPVSCPMKTGWGGAMGPGQFIPSTWIAYKEKVKEITKKSADPWDIKDAFLATGIYLRDLGGTNGTKSEWQAAMKYFSGVSWSKYEEFYGNNVMALTRGYQEDINAIEGGAANGSGN